MSKKGCDDMLNIIKEKLDLSPELKKKTIAFHYKLSSYLITFLEFLVFLQIEF
jgi:hypothetical protein